MSQWTIETLKEYFDQRMDGQRANLALALEAADKAVAKSEIASEKRFDSVNEFRNALADQQRNFVLKSEVDFRFSAIEEKLNVAISAVTETRGKGLGMNALWAILFSAATLLIAIAAVLWHN